MICNSKTLSISTSELPVSYVRVDIIDENIPDINLAINLAYNREKFEGKNFTNGNLFKEI